MKYFQIIFLAIFFIPSLAICQDRATSEAYLKGLRQFNNDSVLAAHLTLLPFAGGSDKELNRLFRQVERARAQLESRQRNQAPMNSNFGGGLTGWGVRRNELLEFDEYLPHLQLFEGPFRFEARDWGNDSITYVCTINIIDLNRNLYSSKANIGLIIGGKKYWFRGQDIIATGHYYDENLHAHFTLLCFYIDPDILWEMVKQDENKFPYSVNVSYDTSFGDIKLTSGARVRLERLLIHLENNPHK